MTSTTATVQLTDIKLTASGVADTIADTMINLNQALIDGMESFNSGLVDGEVGVEKAIAEILPFLQFDGAGPDSILNGVLNRGYNVFNMFLDTVERTFNGVLGAQVDPSDSLGLTQSLIVGLSPAIVFNSGEIGGIEGMLAQGLQALGNATGFPSDSLADSLQAGLIDFNHELTTGELAFNHQLIIQEAALDQALGGNALNGAVNQLINVFNMVLDAGEQSLNGLIGAHVAETTNVYQTITGSLLLDLNAPSDPFATGAIGGLEGILGHGYMAVADLFGLLLGDTGSTAATEVAGGFDALPF